MSDSITKDEFCARFKAELLRIAGEKTGDGDSVAEYADQVTPTYWDDLDQREEGLEACAESDYDCWD